VILLATGESNAADSHLRLSAEKDAPKQKGPTEVDPFLLR